MSNSFPLVLPSYTFTNPSLTFVPDRFRAQQRNEPIIRKTFPQLPYATLKDPRYLTTPSGDTIIISGVYAWARKIHYTCDVYFAVTWGLICGLESPFPWFYPVFFTVMIVHRAWRDITRCRIKYGETWLEYEKRVPWLFIPVSSIHTNKGPLLTGSSMCSRLLRF